MAKRPHGDAERLRPAKLARERACRLAVERTADGETRPHHRVGGEEPPRCPVELDLDASARALMQRGDDRNPYSSDVPPTSATAAAAAAAFAALPLGAPFSDASSSTGRSRAETTCSGPTSSWIRSTICC